MNVSLPRQSTSSNQIRPVPAPYRLLIIRPTYLHRQQLPLLTFASSSTMTDLMSGCLVYWRFIEVFTPSFEVSFPQILLRPPHQTPDFLDFVCSVFFSFNRMTNFVLAIYRSSTLLKFCHSVLYCVLWKIECRRSYTSFILRYFTV